MGKVDRAYNAFTQQERDEMIKLHHQGLTPFAISKKVGRPVTSVRSRLTIDGCKPHLKPRKSAPNTPKIPVENESYAIHSGGRCSISHGLGAEHAERSLDAAVKGFEVFERGVRRIGSSSWAQDRIVYDLARALQGHEVSA
jgi:hypothetical protein